jgi:hypothetical protein
VYTHQCPQHIRGESTGQKTKMNYTPPITALSEMTEKIVRYYFDDGHSRDPDVDTLYRYLLNSDYCDEYYSDNEYSRDPDIDYNDTICYQPGISTRSSCTSGAFHNGISPQPWQCQPNSSSGKSLAKQDPQNRRYPKPRRARKRHKKKRPKPSPPSPPVTGALRA